MLRQLTAQVETLIRDGAEYRSILRELTSAVSRLAVMEERQIAAREALERAFVEIRDTQADIGKIDLRVKTLEIAQPENKATANVVQKAMWLVTAAVIGALLALVLQRPPQNHQTSVPGAMPGLSAK